MRVDVMKTGRCGECGLCLNQPPVMEDIKDGVDIMWVGLSACRRRVDGEKPLSCGTITGSIIKRMEDLIPMMTFYHTNIVKCLPLSDNGKIRYPTLTEAECCFGNIFYEINILSPKIVVILGNMAAGFFEKAFHCRLDKRNGSNYTVTQLDSMRIIPIHHPSYIYVYKRNELEKWIKYVSGLIIDSM